MRQDTLAFLSFEGFVFADGRLDEGFEVGNELKHRVHGFNDLVRDLVVFILVVLFGKEIWNALLPFSALIQQDFGNDKFGAVW